jgi:hypothetical protein
MTVVLTCRAQQDSNKVYNYRTDSVETHYVKNYKWTPWATIPNSNGTLIRVDINKAQIDIYGKSQLTYFITNEVSDGSDASNTIKVLIFNCVDAKGEKYIGTQIVNNDGFILYLKQPDFEMRYFFHKI